MTLADLNLKPNQVRNLYLIHLQQMYSAEEQMFTAAPTLAVAISLPEVKGLLLEEAGRAPDRLTLLVNIFSELGETPHGPICLPIKALIDQSTELNMQQARGPWRDLLLLGLALEMKHINIAKYLMATTYARALNFPQRVQALSNVYRDELDINHRLSSIMEKIHLDESAS